MRIRILNFLLYCFLSLPLAAQTPYSRVGLGLPEEYATARLKGMNSLGIGMYATEFINYSNPASIGKIELTRFQTDATFRGLFLKSSQKTAYLAQTDFEGVSLAFPIYQPYGIAFSAGLVPFTRVDYTTVKEYAGTGNISNYTIENTGNGGISTGYGAVSLLLPYDISLGFRANYYFGQIENSNKTVFSGDASSAEFIRVSNYDGFGYGVGLLSPDLSPLIKSSALSAFHAGLSLDFFSSINVDTMLVLRSTFREDSSELKSGKLSVPLKLGIGLSFLVNNSYRCAADLLYQNMGSLQRFGMPEQSVDNYFRLGGGVEYIQSREAGNTSAPLLYRFGVAYEKLPISLKGSPVTQFSLSTGISLPISRSNYLDVSFSFVRRGETGNNLHAENVYQIHTALNLSELWFVTQER